MRVPQWRHDAVDHPMHSSAPPGRNDSPASLSTGSASLHPRLLASAPLGPQGMLLAALGPTLVLHVATGVRPFGATGRGKMGLRNDRDWRPLRTGGQAGRGTE
jgi:hypothetical protein